MCVCESRAHSTVERRGVCSLQQEREFANQSPIQAYMRVSDSVGVHPRRPVAKGVKTQ